jgi:soluble lytic murein transglycosylase
MRTVRHAGALLLTVPVLALSTLGPAHGADSARGPALAVLSARDAQRYRSIFELQKDGRWADADVLIGALEKPVLLGTVLAQRYLHPTKYRSSYAELRRWLARYADQPDAEPIYRLAVKRRPKGAAAPPAPLRQDESSKAEHPSPHAEHGDAAAILAEIRDNVRKTRLTVSEALLDSARARHALTRLERDGALAEIAKGWYFHGDDTKALALAEAVIRRSGDALPFAHWTAGLAAWRLGRYDQASWHFEAVALAQGVDDWNVASGAYWAARAHLKAGRPAAVNLWLALAADLPRTFYGLLARRSLGLDIDIAFTPPALEPDSAHRFLALPGGRRAVALTEAGALDRARRELDLLSDEAQADPRIANAILVLSLQAGMPEISLELATRLTEAREDRAVYAALYPLPRWQPDGGFNVDRALVYALARQESAFRPKARSHAGARGLLQLMPATAGFIAHDENLRAAGAEKLYEPGLNLSLGQRYIHHLLGLEVVRGDLFRLAAAYNGGPGNLQRWEESIRYSDDPLLFIESLPALETRLYIERVLTNLWIYRRRLGQPSPSLDSLAAGGWPRYVALDKPAPAKVQVRAPSPAPTLAHVPERRPDLSRARD